MLQVGDTVTLGVFYTHTIFEDENFRILNVFAPYEESKFPFQSNDNKVEFIVKGLFSAPDYQYQEIEMTGEWRYDQKYKKYALAVEYVIPTLPTTEKGVFRFCKSIHGIGEKIAKRISSVLQNGFVLPSGKEPDADWFVASIKGMTPSKASSLYSAIRRVNASAELTKILKGCVSGQVVQNIAAKYGTEAIDVVVKTPYKLFFDHAVSFKNADAIALTVGKELTDKERIHAGIIDQVRQRKERLNSIIAEKEIVLHNTLQSLGIPEALIAEEFEAMIGHSLVSAAQYCYLRADYEVERDLARKIADYIEGAQKIPPSDTANYLKKFEEWKKENSICLAERQEEAVKAVANNLLTVLTGGPGTGKTTVLKAVMETYKKAFPNRPTTLMAPAGLAAKRMSEACGAPALTIHKTLGLVPSECDAGFDDTNGLSIDGGLVIVDEVSMVGIHLAKFLFDAVLFKPDTRIVLVGDIDQLPPVSPGSVLDDLIASNCVKVTRLNRNFRQEAGSAIVDAAYAINEGNTNLHFGGNFRMRVIESENIEAETTAILDNVKNAFQWSMDTFGVEQTYVLSPKRKVKPKKDGKDCVDTMLSTMYLNPILRDIANPPSPEKDFFKSGQRIFREGDRVVNLKNTPEVLNGEIGHIKKIEKDDVPVITVDFGDGVEVEYTPDRLKELDWAYAITVHKAQGCEYDSVIYPTSLTHGPMLQRNLLYTAVTRAKKSAVLLGSKTSLNKSIVTVKSKVKKDLLAARIQKYTQENR